MNVSLRLYVRKALEARSTVALRPSAPSAHIEPLEMRLLLSAAPHHRPRLAHAGSAAATHQRATRKAHAPRKPHGSDHAHGGEGKPPHGQGNNHGNGNGHHHGNDPGKPNSGAGTPSHPPDENGGGDNSNHGGNSNPSANSNQGGSANHNGSSHQSASSNQSGSSNSSGNSSHSGGSNQSGGSSQNANSGGSGGGQTASTPAHKPVAKPPVAPPDPGPTATIVAADVTSAGGASETVTITFTDSDRVGAASIRPTNIAVTGPGGALAVTSAIESGGDAATVVATYPVAAPQGAWGYADDGSYTVSLKSDQVIDTKGNPAGGASSSFAVNIPAPPPPPPAPPDPTFAGGQTVSAQFVIEAIAPEADGSVLVAGHEPGATSAQMRGVIEHFNADGSLDPTFGSHGAIVSRSGIDEAYYALILQDSTHFLVGGTSGGNFVVARYSLGGRIDSSFGSGGRAITDFGASDDTARGLAIAPGGAIVAGGDSGGNFAFARYSSSGQLDANFAQGGRQLFGLGSGNNALGDIVLRSDGRILAVGSNAGTVVVARLTAMGEADASFGAGGAVTVSALSARTGSVPDRSEAIAIEGQNILVANRTPTGHFGVVRLTSGGAVDRTFGTNGLATANFGGDDDADSLVVQSSGQIIAIGTTLQNGVAQTAVAAFDPSGNLIPNFGSNGLLALASGNAPAGRELHLGAIVLRAFGHVTADGRVVIGSADVAVASTLSSTLRRIIVPGAQIAMDPSGTPAGTFGMVDGKRKSLTLTDSTGKRITLSLAGGVGTAYRNGDAISLTVNDAGKGVAMIVSSAGRGTVKLQDVTISGTLRSLTAPDANLAGILRVTGAAGRVALGDVSGTILCADNLASLTAGDVSGSISVTGALGRLRVGKLSGTVASARGIIGAVFAASLDNAHVLSGANLGADGRLGGSGADADTFAAGSIGLIHVSGGIASSFIGAGVNPVDRTFGNSDDKAAGASSAIHAILARSADGASRFEAAAFGHAILGKPIAVSADPRFRILS